MAPSRQVSGYFTGGGATVGNQRIRTWRTEFDEDFILNTKNHLIKAGLQGLYYSLDHNLTQNFNGTYIFGGYTAAGGGYLTPLAQYEAAQNGGTATEFNNVAGNSSLKFSQTRIALFYEDTYKATPKLTFSYGLRYFLEVNPTAFNGVAPRVGLVYSPDKKSTWSLKAHFGLFNGQYSIGDADELYREDGVQRVTSLVYNPVYGTPLAGAAPIIHEYRTTAPGFNLPTYVIGEVSVSKELPKGFAATVQEVQIRFLTDARTLNVNSPLTTDPNGPRPLAMNVNILQARNDGSGVGNGTFMGLSNSKLKRVQFFMGAVHINIRENGNDELFSEPQSAYTDAGEGARRSNGNSLWQMFGNVNFTLPYKLSLSGNGYASGGTPFNITTGVDNNGDGDFNDRPQYAAPGSVANGTTIFNTPMGLLTNTGSYVNAVPQRPIARNLGALPWNFHLDANLQRKWVLTRNAKAEHQQSLTANIRSANFLNHTNVTTEGSVLGSPQFLVPVAADTARRVEFGLRYSF